jgi:hypothetical protein
VNDETVMVAPTRADRALQEIVSCYAGLQQAREAKSADAAAHTAIIEGFEREFDEAMAFEIRAQAEPSRVMAKLRAVEQAHRATRDALENKAIATKAAKDLVEKWGDRLDKAISAGSQLTLPGM